MKGAAAAESTVAASHLDDQLRRHKESHEHRAKNSVRRAILIAVALGLLGVGVGLVMTQSRERPAPTSTPRNTPTGGVTAPLEMEALAYLPEGTDSVIALQVRAYVESLGKSGDRDETRNALARLGLPEELLAGVEKVLGVPFGQIDQLVIGLKLNGGALASQPLLVVRTLSAFAAEDLARKRKAAADRRDGRTYYRTNASNLFGERFYWWAPNDRTLLIALNAEVLDGVPATGRQNHLAPALVEQAQALLPKDTSCWAVLDSDSWEALVGLATFASKKNDSIEQLLEVIGYLKSVTIGVRTEDEPFMTVWLDLKSERSAAELRGYLPGRFTEDGGTITVGGAGSRVMVRMPTSAGGLATVLRRALPGKTK